MKALTVQEAALAWAQGKRVEACSPVNSIWLEVTPVASAVQRPRGKYNADVFTSDLAFRFRVATEPPAKKYRPWTPEEVPVGAQVRNAKNQHSVRMLITSSMEPYLLGYDSRWNLEDLCKHMEHSLDNGKTWLPCGVEVEA